MATKRMKHDNGMEQVQEPKAGFEDRISELPDAILIHILSFLPTLNVIRMSLLSKRWRSLWTSVPALDFMESRDIPYFRSLQDKNKGDERKKFCKFIDESLRHLDADTNLSTFKLCMKYHSGCGSQVNGWFRFLEKKNVKELDFCILPGSRRFGHCLPSSLPGLRALSFLKLSGLVLETLVPTSLPFLEELHLEKIKMNDRVLNNLMLSCPTLAKLHLDHCCGFSNPKVSSSSLKSMEFAISSLEPYSCCRIIKVEAINLHSFAYRGGFRYKNCGVRLVPCRTIRNLSLSKAFLTDQQLEDLIPELPLLEHLKLTYCYGFQHINIRNQHLKHFVLRITNHFEEATIYTPNLVSFSCSACLMRKISVDAPSLLNANITIYSTVRKFYDVKWHTDLIKFLSQFKSSKSVGLTVVDEMALIVPDELRKMYSSPLPICKHMKVWIWSPLCRNAMLRKSLLWIAPSIKTWAIG